jgi:NADPH-dependent 2,4-dienoyl-CoA reductase/sulfur reductase-like enzyme
METPIPYSRYRWQPAARIVQSRCAGLGQAHRTEMKQAKRPHVVIVGGGFGGLYAARALVTRGAKRISDLKVR